LSSIPRRLGKYEILRPLAKGGMAEIFLARATGTHGFEKLVVIKRLRPELAHDGDFLRMFLDEARLAATLQHSNVVQVYDFGEEEGVHFIAMEYLHGEDVQRVLRQVGRLPLEHALSIIIGTCAGLHYAHERGIVHRDVSPQNVAVTFEGGVKLVDFGVAKSEHRLTETRHGTVKGKIQYMSPEQCCGDPLDRRSDVFALGVMLWELTTGRRLYSGRSDLLIMKTITELDAPSPSDHVEDYPSDLEPIVMRALRRMPDERYQTAEELQLALEAFARERRLALSPVGLARYMRDLFQEDVTILDDAKTGDATSLERLVTSGLWRPTEVDEEAHQNETVRPGTRKAAPRPPQRRGRLAALIAVAALALTAGGIYLAASSQPAAPDQDVPPAAPADPRTRPATTVARDPAPVIPTAAPADPRTRPATTVARDPEPSPPAPPTTSDPEPTPPAAARPAAHKKAAKIVRKHAPARRANPPPVTRTKVDLDSALPPR
jgi:eukaryotic-like serine/threonine-protein kinase